jgi:hypothetical protein
VVGPAYGQQLLEQQLQVKEMLEVPIDLDGRLIAL